MKTDLLQKWKELEKKEQRDNPFGKFIVDEGEFVTITPGVKQLGVEELTEEEETDGSSNNNSDIPEQQRD